MERRSHIRYTKSDQTNDLVYLSGDLLDKIDNVPGRPSPSKETPGPVAEQLLALQSTPVSASFLQQEHNWDASLVEDSFCSHPTTLQRTPTGMLRKDLKGKIKYCLDFLLRVIRTTLSSSYNISGLVPVCWSAF